MDMMNGAEKVKSDEAHEAEEATKSQARRSRPKPAKRSIVQSSIGFPYRDLEAGIAVAQAIHKAGGFELKPEQLAGVMDLQAGSGNFMIRTYAARMFGLVKYDSGKYGLTDLGFSILDRDDKRQRQARAEAFLNVPLYKKVFDEFRGKQLPPRPLGLEQAFVKFGVSPKQKDTARLVFDKSAAQAGYFANGNNDRLIEPIIGGAPPPGRPPIDEAPSGNGNGRSSGESNEPDVSGFHPFIQGLLDTLPEPNTNWAIEGRAKWLQAAANIFDLIYKGSGEIAIIAKVQPEKE